MTNSALRPVAYGVYGAMLTPVHCQVPTMGMQALKLDHGVMEEGHLV